MIQESDRGSSAMCFSQRPSLYSTSGMDIEEEQSRERGGRSQFTATHHAFLPQPSLPLPLSIQHGFIDNHSLYTDLTILHHFLVRQSDAEVEMGNREESVTNTYRTR